MVNATRKNPKQVEYLGVIYTVVIADADMAVVYDPSINEYGILSDGEVLVYESKAAAEHEFWFGAL